MCEGCEEGVSWVCEVCEGCEEGVSWVCAKAHHSHFSKVDKSVRVEVLYPFLYRDEVS